MTPEEAARRAIACTATGALSGLSKWEWNADLLAWCSQFTVPCRIVDVRQSADQLLVFVPTLESLAWIYAYSIYPDFTHEPTVLAMLPLVRRAWTGHDLTITWHDSGNVDLVVGLYADGGARFWVRDVPLYAALTLALEAAPEKPCPNT